MSFARSFVRSIQYVSVFDPAIDWDRDAPADETPEQRGTRVVKMLSDYQANPDISTLPIKPGEQPTVFELAPLSRMARTLVEQMPDDRYLERAQEAVAQSLRSVKDCRDDQGGAVTIERDKSGRVKASSMDALYNAGVSSEVFQELATRILNDSRLSPTSR